MFEPIQAPTRDPLLGIGIDREIMDDLVSKIVDSYVDGHLPKMETMIELGKFTMKAEALLEEDQFKQAIASNSQNSARYIEYLNDVAAVNFTSYQTQSGDNLQPIGQGKIDGHVKFGRGEHFVATYEKLFG